MQAQDWTVYTENVSPMVAFFHTFVPANGHLPLKLRFAFGADKKLYDLYCNIKTLLPQKLPMRGSHQPVLRTLL